MCIYGDPAYPVRVHLQSPYKGNRLMPAMEAFNESMSKVRTSVEWVFGDIVKSGLGIYIHHYSPPLRGIVVYYYRCVQFCMYHYRPIDYSITVRLWCCRQLDLDV